MADSTDFVVAAGLELAKPAYYKNQKFYVGAHRVSATDTTYEVLYQLTTKLPTIPHYTYYGIPGGDIFLREIEVETQAQYDARQLVELEAAANLYQQTLTGITVITLLGDATETLALDATAIYTDAGFTMSDPEDGTATVTHDGTTYTSDNVNLVPTVVNPVDLATAGTYTITYDAVDSQLIPAKQVTRTVIVA